MTDTTAAGDYRACLEGIALLGEHDLDGAVAVLEPLVDAENSPCRVEAAFLLGVARLTQAVSLSWRRRAAADAFAVAAAGENPVYSPAAAYRYATLLDTGGDQHTRAVESLANSPVVELGDTRASKPTLDERHGFIQRSVS